MHWNLFQFFRCISDSPKTQIVPDEVLLLTPFPRNHAQFTVDNMAFWKKKGIEYWRESFTDYLRLSLLRATHRICNIILRYPTDIAAADYCHFSASSRRTFQSAITSDSRLILLNIYFLFIYGQRKSARACRVYKHGIRRAYTSFNEV